VISRRQEFSAVRDSRPLSLQRPPPNKSMMDEIVGGRVPHVGGGIVGRLGGVGSGGKMRPGSESG